MKNSQHLNHGFRRLILILLTFLIPVPGTLFAQGKVILVIGSDTAIWDGMNVARYNI